jgi:cell wall-associated NlpC family hydrolase
LCSTTPALATPLANLKYKEKNIKQEIKEIDEELEITVEKFNQVRLSLQKTRREIYQISQRARKLKREFSSRQLIFNQHLVTFYKTGKGEFLEFLFSASSFNQFLVRVDYLARLSEAEANFLRELKETRLKLLRERARLKEKGKQERREYQQLLNKKRTIIQRLRTRESLLRMVRQQIRSQEVRPQFNRGRVLLKTNRSSFSYRPLVRVSRGGRGRPGVVSVALAQLGKPYRWGAAGPDAFDCSGLTMYAYAKGAGINLPHSSQAQFGIGRPVSRASLQPGDLVFFARRGVISHVGIYIGNGNFVEAPRTGLTVRISKLSSRSDYVGARRP